VWPEFDIKESIWHIPGERTKNKQPDRRPAQVTRRWRSRRASAMEGGREGLSVLFTTTRAAAVSGFAKAKQGIDKKVLEIQKAEAIERGKGLRSETARSLDVS